jgi:RimJ/RimL family protein N-acetyltransferase
MIELLGEKITLRTLEREHCRELWLAYEPESNLPTEPLYLGLSVEGADQWFEEIQSQQGKGRVHLGVFTQEGRLIGDIQLAEIDWRHRTANIGLGISRKADRGQGYGRDATITLLGYAFQHLDLHRVSAAVVSHNLAAQQILEKCGFIREGQERESIYCAGKRYDRLRYGLLRTDFEQD